MDVRAVVLVTPGRLHSESLGGVPTALLPVLGRTVVEHVVDRLARAGVDGTTVVSQTIPAAYLRPAQRSGIRWLQPGPNGDVWRTAETVFSDFAQAGADIVLALRLGPYAELDIDRLVQFHFDQHNRVTAVDDEDGPLDAFVISASRRNDAAFLFRHKLASFRTSCGRFPFRGGYVNRLFDTHDLRRLATDAFAQRNTLVPAGTQIKPGVWVEDGARIHRGARVLAPAFIGARSKIRAAVVLTRGAVIEHHSEIDCGTVVEDATVLPYTYIGAGLDLAHAVAGFQRMTHLTRGVSVEINDPKLVGTAPTAAPLRALAAAGALAGFLPLQFFRGLFAPSHREPLTELPAAVQSPPPVLQAPAAEVEGAAADPDSTKFPSNLVVARRYGDQ